MNRSEKMKNVKRMVIKLGTSSLTHDTGLINITQLDSLVKQVADIYNAGYEVVIVSSGAIAAGMGKMKMTKKPKAMPELQAAAAVGQVALIHMYQKMFSEYGIVIGQLLLTKDGLENKERYNNAKNSCTCLLERGVIPIVNENDAVVVDEIKVGDNDTLSAYVNNMIESDLLIILSDIEGLYDKNPLQHPDAKLIHHVEAITDEVKALAEGPGGSLGTGGMVTKLLAGEIVRQDGGMMVIANGKKVNVLGDVLRGKDVGTLFF